MRQTEEARMTAKFLLFSKMKTKQTKKKMSRKEDVNRGRFEVKSEVSF